MEFIENIKDSIREYKAKQKELYKSQAMAKARFDAVKYYNIDFDNKGYAFIMFDGERITTPDENQDTMLAKLLTLRNIYIENKLKQ